MSSLSTPIDRRAVLRAAGAALVAAVLRPAALGAAGPDLLVEDWQAAALGATGVPPGWRPYETPGGHPAYDFTIVADDGRRALSLRSAGDHSTIAKEVHVDLAITPILRWEWKVAQFPAGVDLRRKSGSDATGHVFVVWPRFPALLRSQLLGYVWDPVLPAGTFVRSAKTGTVTFVIARSGTQGTGRWAEQERNVADDYRTAFGADPPSPGAVALSIDTNDTRSPAAALVGRIAFTSGRG